MIIVQYVEQQYYFVMGYVIRDGYHERQPVPDAMQMTPETGASDQDR